MKSLVKMKGYEVWNLHGNCEEQLLEKPGWLTGYNYQVTIYSDTYGPTSLLKIVGQQVFQGSCSSQLQPSGCTLCVFLIILYMHLLRTPSL